MKTLSIINMKGGCAKTISAINIAHILTAEHAARVLLVDMDKQGNASKFFEIYSYEAPSIADVLTARDCPASAAIQETAYERLHLIPANMSLLTANRTILLDVTRPQQTRLASALEEVSGNYDYCVIDCAPDINMGTINALVASDMVLVPISMDKFSFDGLGELIDQVVELRAFNPRLHISGAFATMIRRDGVNAGGLAWLRANSPLPMFNTAIRATVRVSETTYNGVPLLLHAPRSTATQDYKVLVKEIVSETDTGREGK